MPHESYYDRFASLDRSASPQVEERPNPEKLGSSKLSKSFVAEENFTVPILSNFMLHGQFVQNPRAFQQDPMLYQQYQLNPAELKNLAEDEVYYALPAEGEGTAENGVFPQTIPAKSTISTSSLYSTNYAPINDNDYLSGLYSRSQESFIIPSEPQIPFNSMYAAPHERHRSFVAHSQTNSYAVPPALRTHSSYIPSTYADSSFSGYQPHAAQNYGNAYVRHSENFSHSEYHEQGYAENVSSITYPPYAHSYPYNSNPYNNYGPQIQGSFEVDSSVVQGSYAGHGSAVNAPSLAAPVTYSGQYNASPRKNSNASNNGKPVNPNLNGQDSRKGSHQSQDNLLGKDYESLRPPKKFMYGCVPVNRQQRKYCLIILSFVVLIVAVLIYLFFPRFPEQKVTSIVIAKDNSFSLTPVDLTAPTITFDFTMNMIMTVNVTNTNFYPLTVNNIDISAFLIANASQINAESPSPAQKLFGRTGNRIFVTPGNEKAQIGSGTYGTITFPPNQQVSFQIPFKVSYSPDKYLGAVNDPAMSELIQLCVEDPVLSPTNNRTSVITYDAINTISVLSWFGYKPKLSNQININCPFQGSAKQKFINALQGNATATGKSVAGRAVKSLNGGYEHVETYDILASAKL